MVLKKGMLLDPKRMEEGIQDLSFKGFEVYFLGVFWCYFAWVV